MARTTYRDPEVGTYLSMLRGPSKYHADTAPRSEVKSRYACQWYGCEHGPSNGHPVRDGYCKEHR